MQQLLLNVFSASPLILACLVGVIFAFLNYLRFPKACLLAILGLAGLAATLIVRPLAYALIFRALDPEQIGFVSGILNFSFNIVDAGLTGLVIAAVFTDRQVGEPTLPRGL